MGVVGNEYWLLQTVGEYSDMGIVYWRGMFSCDPVGIVKELRASEGLSLFLWSSVICTISETS